MGQYGAFRNCGGIAQCEGEEAGEVLHFQTDKLVSLLQQQHFLKIQEKHVSHFKQKGLQKLRYERVKAWIRI